MNREASLPQPPRRRGVLLAGGVLLAVLLAWLVHGLILRELVVRVGPWVLESEGYALRMD